MNNQIIVEWDGEQGSDNEELRALILKAVTDKVRTLLREKLPIKPSIVTYAKYESVVSMSTSPESCLSVVSFSSL